jgi:sugar (pentulose or hexulose) kinase
MAFEFARVFAPVARGALDSLVLCGGASRAAHFQALFATLFSPLPVYKITESDLMAARGSLFAFESRAIAAPVRRVRAPAKFDTEAMVDAQALYQETFDQMYGHVAAGKPYEIMREK